MHSPFQFTTSQGGRHPNQNKIEYVNILSIHDLTRRSTSATDKTGYRPYSFNSRPHKEVDQAPEYQKMGMGVFQFTTSQGGRRIPKSVYEKQFSFQFTTSQGGRLQMWMKIQCLVHFQFTTSQGGRRGCNNSCGCGCSFNSRPHKEVDCSYPQNEKQAFSFNSRPHKEVDCTLGSSDTS